MCTIVVEALTPFDQISCIKMYKNNARSRLFCRIAKRSITVVPRTLIKDWNTEIINFFTPNFSQYYSVKWKCFPAPMVPGTDLNGTGYRGLWYLVLRGTMV